MADVTSPLDYIIYTAAVIAALGAIGGSLLGIIKLSIKASLFYKGINKVVSELSPNDGSSVKDAISRIENRQLRSESRQHIITDQSNLPYFETDNEGKCTWINKSYCNLVGRSREECYGHGWVLNVHPDDREYVSREWEMAISDQRDFALDYRFYQINNETPIPVHVKAHVIKNDLDKKVIGWVGFVTVINNYNV